MYQINQDISQSAYSSYDLLRQACRSGSVSVQTLIREHKANVNAKDDDNNIPLCVAALTSKTEVVASP